MSEVMLANMPSRHEVTRLGPETSENTPSLPRRKNLTEHAIGYASLGWLIVAVKGKVPIGDEWQKLATNDQAKLAKWIHQSGADGVGVQLGQQSGLIDFDCDSDEAEQTFQALFGGDGPRTPMFKSTRGKHRLFRWREGLPQPDKIKFVVNGLEIRTGSGNKGAQTVLPPSGVREWIVDPFDCPLAELPQAVVDRICELWNTANARKVIKAQSGYAATPYYGDGQTLDVPRWLAKHGHEILGREDLDDVTRWYIHCPREDRHTTANSYKHCCVTQEPSGRLGGHCLHSSCGMTSWADLRDAIGKLTRDDFVHELPPLPPVDVSAIVDGQATAKPEEPVDAVSEAVPTISPDLLHPGGLLQQVIDFNLRTAIKPQPELALAGAIALVATVIGRKVEDDYGTRPNVYLVGIGHSGSGKDNARRVNKVLLAAAGAELMLQDDLASSAGLHAAMVASPSTLLQLDEFGRFLATLGNPSKSPFLYGIVSVLLKLFSSSSSLYLGPSYADPKKNARIPFPNCVLYGTTVPASFFGALTREALSDGLFNRLLIVEASNSDPELQTPDPPDAPFSLVEAVRWWVTFHPGATNIEPTARRLFTSSDAKEEFSRLDVTVRQRQREEEKRGTQVWGRCSENARKLALIHQCSLDRESSAISVESARWGCLLALHLTTRVELLAEAHVADGEFDTLAKKLLRFVLEGPNRERTKTEVCRHMRGQKPRELDEIVNKLISTEEMIVGTRDSPSGPTTTVYRAL